MLIECESVQEAGEVFVVITDALYHWLRSEDLY